MVWNSNNLQTRQFVRRDVSLPARVEVHREQADQLRLAFSDAHSRITVIDVSEGGVGLRSGVFIPKNARLTVRVTIGEGDAARIVTVEAIVRRAAMTDIKPTYQLGLQYLETSTPDQQALLEAVRGAPPAPEAADER